MSHDGAPPTAKVASLIVPINAHYCDQRRTSNEFHITVQGVVAKENTGDAWRPAFPSVLWTLTWAEEDPGQPTEHFQLTISGRHPDSIRETAADHVA